ncbi:hypothetical protein ACP70R_030548 [Stipagrostis hirtigluma subsp. patula]
MAPPPSTTTSPPPPAWSVALRLKHRGGLEIRASAENVLPGWGRGGERLSLLLRLRRSLRLAVTSQCGPRAPAPSQPRAPPRGYKILRFLRSGWARVPSVWRRKKPPGRAAAAAAVPGPRSQASHLLAFRQNRASTPTIQCHRAWTLTAATVGFVAAVLAVATASLAAFRLTVGHWGECRQPIAHCESWRCFFAKKLTEFLEPSSLDKWLLRLPKLGFKWLLSK